MPKSSFRLFALLIFTLNIFTFPAFGATPQEPALRKAVLQDAYPSKDGFTLSFVIDEAQCKAKYGRQWRQKCAITLGRPGAMEKNIRISPPVSGHWEWRDDTSVAFVPEKADSLHPGTLYKVDFSQMPLPGNLRIDRRKASLRAWPLGARLLSSDFWVDPSPASRHRLAASLEFNYPASELAIKVSIPGVKTGEPELVWNNDHDRLNISWPVSSLCENITQAEIAIAGAGRIDSTDDGWRFTPAENVVFRQNVPGLKDLFSIKEARLERRFNDNLDSGCGLSLETSLYASPEEILRHLRIWELPKFNASGAVAPYDWSMAPVISADVLKRARKLSPVPLDKNQSSTSRFNFRLDARDNAWVLVLLEKDACSASGLPLGKTWHRVLAAPAATGRVGFLQPGNTLPLTGNGQLDIYGSDLDAIRWKVEKVRDPFLAIVAQASGNVFEVPLEEAGIGFESVSESATGEIAAAEDVQGKARFFALPLAKILASLGGRQSGLARISLAGIKDGEEKTWASKLVLATDLALIVKSGADGSLDCFVAFLGDGKPCPGAEVAVLGANGQPVVKAQTDAGGHARLPSLTGLKREAAPVAVVARVDDDLSWLPLKDKNRELNFSNFATGGVNPSAAGLNAMAFSQRGVYRPGDNLHFGVLARGPAFGLLPAELPLYAELSDPRGVIVWETIFRSGVNGLATLEWGAPESALSGPYILNIRPAKKGDILASCQVRVEDFTPETLKMKIRAPEVKGWLLLPEDQPQTLDIALQNLYGTPAVGNRVKGRINASPAEFRFKGFEDYVFSDAAPFKGEGASQELASAQTGADGVGALKLPVGVFGNASALITVEGEGFEAGGGRAATGRENFLVSPMRHIVGYKPLGPALNLEFLPRNSTPTLEFIALDHLLGPVQLKDVEFSVSNRRYVSSLVADGVGGFRYDETPVDEPFKTWKGEIGVKGLKVVLPAEVPGQFLLLAKDKGGRILARLPYAVAGNALHDSGEALAGSRMRLRLDKQSCQPGDILNLAMAFPYAVRGLITIESDRVKNFSWFDANAGESVHSITVPEDFEGKGYVVVTAFRANSEKDAYRQPLVCAVEPFTASMASRDMGLRLQAPEKVGPGQILKVNLEADKTGEAIIFAVDEGILQLDGYRLPRPLNSLLGDMALGTRTLQALDLLMPTHGYIAGRDSAFGGGMDGGAFGNRFANPFKRRAEPPLVFWSGIVKVGREKTEASIPVPAWYVGSIRLMAVGAGEKCAGQVARNVLTDAPLLIKPSFPLAAAPGDEFEAAILVENTSGEDLQAVLSIVPEAGVALKGEKERSFNLKKGASTVIPAKFRATDTLGEGCVALAVKGGKYSFERVVSLSIRPGSPLAYRSRAGIATASQDLRQDRQLYPQHARTVATVSATPLPLERALGRYLEFYPFGCSEQLVSRAFAVSLLGNSARDAEAAKKLLNAALGAIRERFTGAGVALWPNSEPDLLLTAYTADFLLTQRERGLPAPEDLLNRLCQVLEYNCALNDVSLPAARASAYAIWVLTRSGRVTTQLLENLRMALEERGIYGWREDVVAALIAACQAEMRMAVPMPVGEIKYSGEGWFDDFALKGLHMALLARYAPDKCDAALKAGFYEAVVEVLNGNGYATFSAAQGIRALEALKAAGSLATLNARLDCLDPLENGELKVDAAGAVLSHEGICQKYHLDLEQGPLFWEIASRGYDKNPPEMENGRGIKIARRYLNLDGSEKDAFNQGEIVVIEVTAATTEDAIIKDCVITDLLPGGFEMIFPKASADKDLRSSAAYVDRKEDRMLIFADLEKQPKRFSWKARCVAPGVFVAPPVLAEAMYNQAVYGNSSASIIKIASQKDAE